MEESGTAQTKVDDGCGRGLLGKLLQFLGIFFSLMRLERGYILSD